MKPSALSIKPFIHTNKDVNEGTVTTFSPILTQYNKYINGNANNDNIQHSYRMCRQASLDIIPAVNDRDNRVTMFIHLPAIPSIDCGV